MGNRVKTSAEVSRELEEELELALAKPSLTFGYARYGDGVAWKRLDILTGGIQKYEFSVVAARPKVGKSMWLAGLAPYIAEQAMWEDKVLRMVTLETRTRSYQRRIAAIMAKIKNPLNIRRGMLTEQEQRDYREALGFVAGLPIEYLSNERDLEEAETFVPGKSNITYDDVHAFVDQPNTFYWALDHIGLLNDLNSSGDLTKSIFGLANKLSILAHTVCSGIVVTHLTRASVGGMPGIESISGSDQVGRNADKIFLLHRPFLGADVTPEQKAAVAEQEPTYMLIYSRDEGSGVDMLWWLPDRASFEEADVDENAEIPMPARRRR